MNYFLKPIFLVILLFSSVVFSQDVFKPGYYIDNAANKINGLILDNNPYNNPSGILFKSTETDAPKTIGIESLKEFSVTERNNKFQRYKVEIDINSTRSNNIEKTASSKVENTSLFKVLIEGELSLYKLVINDKTIFFYKANNESVPQQLENSTYVNNNGVLTEEKSFFRRQLIKLMNCNDFKTIQSFLQLGYNEKELIEVFSEYNTCKNSGFTVYKESAESQKVEFKFTPFAGMNFSNLKYELVGTNFSPSGSTTGINLGIETAIVLPYNNKSYELFLAIGLDKIDDISSRSYPSGTSSVIFENYIFNSTLINFNLGPRYNYYINQKNKIFFDASVGLSIPQEDVVFENYTETTTGGVFYTTQGEGRRYSTRSAMFFTAGIGYCFNNKLGIALRYSTPKEYVEGNSLRVKLSSLGVTLRYTIN